ncbi:hypothetical protein JKG68_02880 [Microvirga aerilata]|uniref:Uncharacterized protein n=2 Tax=Microvirga aerilata TaxID=670292 RepID=A0A936ZAJ4_9HYPH|nr:hypothetical protein [Microvirga aerilata]MBL0402904.1 hypothetical protein [Microvirga aerilata]
MTLDDIVDLIHADHQSSLGRLLHMFRTNGFPEGCTEESIITMLELARDFRIEEAEELVERWPIIVSTENWSTWIEMDASKEEVREWARENLHGGWDFHHGLKLVSFENDVDAVFFKLRWR